MNTSKALLAGATVALFLASAPESQAAKWSLFGLGGGQQQDATPPADTGTPPATTTAQSDAERVGQLETQVRDLTGQVETLSHDLQVVQDQLKRLQADSDFRFSQLEGGKAIVKPVEPPPPQAAAAPQPIPVPDTSVVQLDTTAPGATNLDAPPPPGETPLDLSALAGAADDASAGTAGAAPPPATAAPAPVQTASLGGSGDARTDYEQAYALINGGQYDLATQAFRKFLAAYPKDDLAPDAQYWLGESLFAHGDYASAAEEFKTGFQSYPKSKRAPDSLLKLGLSMAGLGYRTEACKMYALALRQYPQMPNGLRQRVKTEQASAACS